MNIIRNIEEFRKEREKANKKVGFVPTMGALHEGHLSLIKKAKEENDFVIVSIFVNPTQFLKNEDFSKYPKKEAADIEICRLAGVDILFLPDANEIYQKDEPKVIAPNIRGFILEGFHRPEHFDGVLTVVLKLLNLAKANNAYFGKKDAQQLILITQMAKNFFIDTNIIPCDTVREKSGLALSSRNVYLNQDEKTKALSLSKSLYKAVSMIQAGDLNTKNIIKEMEKILCEVEIDYAAITDRELNDIEKIELKNTVILVAARVGTTRLIDNMWI